MSKQTFLERVIHGYRKWSLHSKALLWVIVGITLLLLVPGALRQRDISNLHKARIYFSTSDGGIVPGQTFSVEVRVQTNGTSVNATSVLVHYNPIFLEVVSMTTENSFCTFYLDNTFDNIRGTVTVSCGLPNPGFQGDSVIVHMNMRAKVTGDTTVTLDPSSEILANDGHGTAITQTLPDLPLTIKQLL